MWPFGPSYPVLKKVIVNTKTDRAFRGVLWRRTPAFLVLRNAEMVRARGEAAPVDGEIVIPAENVDFLQVVG